ncbi:MAG TPA: hypothetical protein VLU73_07510 [Methylococcaceae bacterium]|nr:hypothetical protein [Methylococcaceae bacterium]
MGRGLLLGGVAVREKKRSVSVLPELVAQDPETAGGVAEPGGGLLGGEFFNEEGA